MIDNTATLNLVYDELSKYVDGQMLHTKLWHIMEGTIDHMREAEAFYGLFSNETEIILAQSSGGYLRFCHINEPGERDRLIAFLNLHCFDMSPDQAEKIIIQSFSNGVTR